MSEASGLGVSIEQGVTAPQAHDGAGDTHAAMYLLGVLIHEYTATARATACVELT
jgi:hypothetical protein